MVFDLPTSPHQEITLGRAWEVCPALLGEIVVVMVSVNQKIISEVVLGQGLHGASHGRRSPRDLDSQAAAQQCSQHHLVQRTIATALHEEHVFRAPAHLFGAYAFSDLNHNASLFLQQEAWILLDGIHHVH